MTAPILRPEPTVMPHRPGHRRGTVLIVVAATAALMASLAVVFVTHMRSDVEESQIVLQHAQAKIMLAAACNYVQECSRLGWDANYPYYQQPPTRQVGASTVLTVPNGTGVLSLSGQIASLPNPATLPAHQETYGWVDVRDGSLGPNYRASAPPYPSAWNPAKVVPYAPGKARPLWPAPGSVAICALYVKQRPPFATQLTAAYNPITTTPGDPTFGLPYLRYPDPMPVVSNGWAPQSTTGTVTGALYDDGQGGATRSDFVHGDPTPRAQTTGRSWFRVYRDGPATFVVTCGAGGTLGWRDWNEVQYAGGATAMAEFNNDPDFFASLLLNETRLWYRIEWSSAVMEQTYQNIQHASWWPMEHYLMWPANSSHTWGLNGVVRTQTWAKNPVGTIRWIERLQMEPTLY